MMKEKKQTFLLKKIEVDFNSESQRFNLDSIFWYKKIVMAIYVLLIYSGLMIVIAGVFAVSKPFPEVYASTMEGELYLLDYSRNIDEKIKTLHNLILVESEDVKKIKSGKK